MITIGGRCHSWYAVAFGCFCNDPALSGDNALQVSKARFFQRESQLISLAVKLVQLGHVFDAKSSWLLPNVLACTYMCFPLCFTSDRTPLQFHAPCEPLYFLIYSSVTTCVVIRVYSIKKKGSISPNQMSCPHLSWECRAAQNAEVSDRLLGW